MKNLIRMFGILTTINNTVTICSLQLSRRNKVALLAFNSLLCYWKCFFAFFPPISIQSIVHKLTHKVRQTQIAWKKGSGWPMTYTSEQLFIFYHHHKTFKLISLTGLGFSWNQHCFTEPHKNFEILSLTSLSLSWVIMCFWSIV